MRSMALRMLVTLATGTCSLAPALALTAAAVTPAALSFGMTTPLAPAPSATPHRPEVVRVGHAVEDHYEGIRGRQQVFQIDVGVRPNPRRHPWCTSPRASSPTRAWETFFTGTPAAFAACATSALPVESRTSETSRRPPRSASVTGRTP